MNRTELQARAGRLGVEPSAIAKDYVLNHLLAAIAEGESILLFRGGTALARVYWPDYRLSEDLDFLTIAKHDQVGAVLRQAVSTASARTGLDLRLKFALKRDWEIRLAHQLRELPDFDEAWNCVAEVFDQWEASWVSNSSGH